MRHLEGTLSVRILPWQRLTSGSAQAVRTESWLECEATFSSTLYSFLIHRDKTRSSLHGSSRKSRDSFIDSRPVCTREAHNCVRTTRRHGSFLLSLDVRERGGRGHPGPLDKVLYENCCFNSCPEVYNSARCVRDAAISCLSPSPPPRPPPPPRQTRTC